MGSDGWTIVPKATELRSYPGLTLGAALQVQRSALWKLTHLQITVGAGWHSG